MLCYIVSCKYMAINTFNGYFSFTFHKKYFVLIGFFDLFNGIIIHFVDKSTDCDIM